VLQLGQDEHRVSKSAVTHLMKTTTRATVGADGVAVSDFAERRKELNVNVRRWKRQSLLWHYVGDSAIANWVCRF